MKQNVIQQEILLMPGTPFSSRESLKKDFCNNRHVSKKEKLEHVCWNGMFQEMLPEIFDHRKTMKKYTYGKPKRLLIFSNLNWINTSKKVRLSFSSTIIVSWPLNAATDSE